ncbi:MAG: hypothetical protein K2K56_12260, partial [Lachnospiraceae bacterium]|nr:hypothetical protein [Lachnospiraceae bacterium]
ILRQSQMCIRDIYLNIHIFFEQIIFPWFDKKYDLYNRKILLVAAMNDTIQIYRKYWDRYYDIFQVAGVITENELSFASEYVYDYIFVVDLPYVDERERLRRINEVIKKAPEIRNKLLEDDIVQVYFDNVRKMQWGQDYPDKEFMLIKPAQYHEGLACIALYVARNMVYAKKRGYIPVIDMKSQNSQYLKSEEYGQVNAYTKFFCQPAGYDVDDIKTAKSVWVKQGYTIWQSKKEWAQLKMPPMQPELYEEFVEFKKCLDNKRVLGVLFRGTDYANMKPYGHEIQPDLPMMIETVKQKMSDWGDFDLIYLCTEVKQACEQFISEFGSEKVCYYPQLRYESDTKELLAEIPLEEDGHTKQGKGYWIALNCLALCDSLVAGNCAGTTVAVTINGQQYQHKYIFDLGRYGIDE